MHERYAHHVGDVYHGSVGSVQKGIHLHNAHVSTTNDFGGGFPTSPSTFGSVDHNLSPGLALPRRVERARSPSRRDTEPPQYPRLPAGAHLETHTQQPTFNDGRQQERPAFFVVDSATGERVSPSVSPTTAFPSPRQRGYSDRPSPISTMHDRHYFDNVYRSSQQRDSSNVISNSPGGWYCQEHNSVGSTGRASTMPSPSHAPGDSDPGDYHRQRNGYGDNQVPPLEHYGRRDPVLQGTAEFSEEPADDFYLDHQSRPMEKRPKNNPFLNSMTKGRSDLH
ncbi:hypothetical protein CC2G_000073 [Coprinopsis cinerea AmutBmut pab1-1]|nr:hypothetical protein CC2G_000073 [Coprinopsis cinerea AmutBmut pab1-1]